MKSNRFALFTLLMVPVVGLAGCGSNSSSKTDADVVLSVNIPQGPADVDMATSADVIITSMSIQSKAKNQSAVLSTQDDAVLNQWVVTCTRTDGGTVASPQWTNYYEAYVPAGGSVSLQNYRIFPSEYFQQPPLNQLLCSGCFDKETNNPNIRQRLHIVVYGKEVSGKDVSVSFDVNLNFYYQ